MSTIEGHDILLLSKQNNALRKQVADLRAALEPFADQIVEELGMCHRGICLPDECARCRPILRAQRILAATQPQEVQE